MSIATLIIGESGSGKTTALRNLDPAETLLIQAIRKPLPFRAKGWAYFGKESPTGNIFVTDQSVTMIDLMRRTRRKIIVIDDLIYALTNEYMRRSDETSFQKFADIGRHTWDILNAAQSLPEDVRVYILTHSQTDEGGRTRVKTIGKLLDEKIVVEGMFSIVLRAVVINGAHVFSTKNNGADTCKTPIGMFEDEHVSNDLAAVDKVICDFYSIGFAHEAT